MYLSDSVPRRGLCFLLSVLSVCCRLWSLTFSPWSHFSHRHSKATHFVSMTTPAIHDVQLAVRWWSGWRYRGDMDAEHTNTLCVGFTEAHSCFYGSFTLLLLWKRLSVLHLHHLGLLVQKRRTVQHRCRISNGHHFYFHAWLSRHLNSKCSCAHLCTDGSVGLTRRCDCWCIAILCHQKVFALLTNRNPVWSLEHFLEHRSGHKARTFCLWHMMHCKTPNN